MWMVTNGRRVFSYTFFFVFSQKGNSTVCGTGPARLPISVVAEHKGGKRQLGRLASASGDGIHNLLAVV